MRVVSFLTLAMVLALGIGGAAAQGGAAAAVESFRGTVKAVSATSVTVERGTLSGIFTVDTGTHVAARGASTATKKAKEAGKAGLTVPDAVHVGDQVVVRYHEVSGKMMATDIQVRASVAQK